ncbi:uncharacterized protein MELLADRAFT_86677 [Melampsora larici-populina 98AG31]|uniref:Uncharacterized protein n=1 Tax=Melampsora larici-populina (strain 98AG31 / pathotype 3-4-7) TaxID=747676 RepID=F4R301_MELLP|nr:uncharacterized protein MELLADRAFT_86677 [Melampsora larici-populina 98AG31]EGG12540.1 hypothetical protein MELLADRAFT_86677 [Melampsora larici-populina 98AG31]
MSPNHSHSPSGHPKLTHLTRDRSASLPQSNLQTSRPNAFDSNVPYAYTRKGSLPYNNLPRYPPNEQTSDDKQDMLPSLPLPRKASLATSSVFGDDYVPLSRRLCLTPVLFLSRFAPYSSPGSSRNNNAATGSSDGRPSLSDRPPLSSPVRSSGTSTYSRRKFPTIGQHPKLPSVEPLKIVKRRAGHTPLDHPSGSPTSPSSGFASVPGHVQELLIDYSTAPPPPQILSAPLGRFRNNSVGEFAQASAFSVDGAFKNNETTGYVYKPSAVVLTDEYYYSQNPIQEPLQRSSSLSRVRKMSGSLFKKLKGGENKK